MKDESNQQLNTSILVFYYYYSQESASSSAFCKVFVRHLVAFSIQHPVQKSKNSEIIPSSDDATSTPPGIIITESRNPRENYRYFQLCSSRAAAAQS